MKLRYYKDKSIYFCIMGLYDGNLIVPIMNEDKKFESLKDCMIYMYANRGIESVIKSSINSNLIISMHQIDDSRDSTKNNILYYCETAIFKFDNSLRLQEIIFDFRKNIEPKMSSAIYDCKSGILTYQDQSVIAMDFLANDCLDKELSHFLLYEDKNFTY